MADRITGPLDEITGSLDGITGSLDGITGSLDGITRSLDGITRSLDGITASLTGPHYGPIEKGLPGSQAGNAARFPVFVRFPLGKHALQVL